jgi:antitoxin (DNA-binding transcriptional repressor) of toxin-antitoxin stability system
MTVDLQYAETHLADLISAASRGEAVQIEGPEFTAQILASPAPKPASGRRILGAARGRIAMPPMEDWIAADKELERLMNDSPVFPDEIR